MDIVKKDLIFAPILALIGVMLCLLKVTGMPAHIAISVVGIVVLVVYTILTKKEWKIPALEIIMRVFYGIALITGIVVMNVDSIMALSIIHKVSAALFLVGIVALFVTKLVAKKKA